ncbi:uncharacterized protein (TIGR02678 family) [Haloactinospora alba]|uniref:Uncharacterized protein (TIGR02678 family) n=1 Tax=Haloactinospora alba TaxID=405555 RepID=A0A543NMM4_9ACTN|nr:TIGR02678 family protein [Haloactinospora alba]TQN33073.1 uncharacterized protein (TIGR02678 family) [Haloactinospora alba]
MASSTDNALTGERQTAARCLLARPLIAARRAPEEFALIRSHSDWLIQRFHRTLGYELTVAEDHARLAKAGLVRPVSQPPRRASGVPFTPRTYTCLALCLAVLVEAPPRITVAQLAAQVRAAASEAGVDLDPDTRRGERGALVAALRHLAWWGAVTVDGSALSAYVTDGTAQAELGVHAAIARDAMAHPPTSTSEPAVFLGAMADDDPVDDAAGETELRRMLAETAVVYRADLSDRQRARLARHQWRAVSELGELLGCDAEIRAEGVALVLPGETGGESAAVFPNADPTGHAALVLLERLVARLAPERGPTDALPVPPEVMEQELAAVTDPEGGEQRGWARTAAQHVPDPGETTNQVLDLLHTCGLAARTGDAAAGPHEGWCLRPAAARYGGRPPSPGTEEPE